ncbi:MAG: hypothetical protein KDB88_05340 [Flavobacteriales bacterium]|nr:hypothetical protein [Flavobacteriales bacterium]
MKNRSISLLLVTGALASCGGGTPSVEEAPKEKLVIGDASAGPGASLYQMPTPNELFSIVRTMAGEGQKRMMNPANNADRYVSLSARAFNFGVCATDLVYASYFKLNVEVVRYYLTVKKLGDRLGLGAAFSDADFVRLEANLARGDSLEVISNEAYYRAYTRMQDEDMGPTLALVLAGGWVESMHLVMQQIGRFDPNDMLVARVAEQKVSLEHLIEMMAPHSEDPNVGPVRVSLIGLRDIYDRTTVKRTPHEGLSRSGRMVLGDDVTVEMTEEIYLDLVQAVEEFRAGMVAPEDAVKVKMNA